MEPERIGNLFIGVLAPTTLSSEVLSRVISRVDRCFPPHVEVTMIRSFPGAPASYRKEMTSELVSCQLALAGSGGFEKLRTLKHLAMRIEKEHSRDGARTINLNPGIVTPQGMYLASHKDKQLRTFIGSGVWVEQQMVVERGRLIALPNLFPEYHWAECQSLLAAAYSVAVDIGSVAIGDPDKMGAAAI